MVKLPSSRPVSAEIGLPGVKVKTLEEIKEERKRKQLSQSESSEKKKKSQVSVRTGATESLSLTIVTDSATGQSHEGIGTEIRDGSSDRIGTAIQDKSPERIGTAIQDKFPERIGTGIQDKSHTSYPSGNISATNVSASKRKSDTAKTSDISESKRNVLDQPSGHPPVKRFKPEPIVMTQSAPLGDKKSSGPQSTSSGGRRVSVGKGHPRPHQQTPAQPTRLGSSGGKSTGRVRIRKPTKGDSSGEPHSEKKLLENLNDMLDQE